MNRRTFFAFASPSIIIMLALMVFPLVISIWLSLNFITFRNINDPTFIGLQNYAEVLSDRMFWQSFWFTLLFIAITVPAKILLGFILAILLDQISITVRGLFIAAFLMPFIVVPVVGTLMFKQLFEPGGLMYWFLGEIIGNRFFFDETSVKALIIFHDLWASTPFILVVLFAGLQTLPEEIVEASMIDGANRLRQIRHIMIPHLGSLFVFVGLIAIMDGYRVFDSVFVLTEQNPVFKADVMMSYVFRTAVSVERLGKANAMSVLTVIAILIILIPFLVRTYREQLEER